MEELTIPRASPDHFCIVSHKTVNIKKTDLCVYLCASDLRISVGDSCFNYSGVHNEYVVSGTKWLLLIAEVSCYPEKLLN